MFRIALVASLALSAALATGATLVSQRLTVEGRSNPEGIDSAAPRLGWQLVSTDARARGKRQTAYQVIAATTGALLDEKHADLWNSGCMRSPLSQHIPYAGKPLASSQVIHWKMRVWDEGGRPGPWSQPARFVTGVLAPADWRDARWITLGDGTAQSALLRREFFVGPGLRRAVLHSSGLGQYEVHINGAKLGTELLMPGWTDYRKTVLYDTHDVTTSLRAGANALGLALGNGMYRVEKTVDRYNKFAGDQGPQKAIALLQLDYADGRREFVKTDTSWQAGDGPLTYSNVYGGEDFDARRFDAGWSRPGLQAAWQPAAEIAAPAGVLTGLSAAGSPVRVIEPLVPKAITPLSDGVLMVDLGQNASVMPRLRVRGEAGSNVRITPSELLDARGELDDTMTGGKAHWNYTLAGQGEEAWFPQFFYRGARYLKVELAPATPGGPRPQLLALQADVVHADVDAIGSFETSNELFNRIYTLVRWAQRSNLMSVMTDCPQREKLGWVEQAYLNGPALRYNFALASLFEKALRDMADSQTPSGLVPDIAPEYVVFQDGFRDSVEWGSAFIQVSWQHYLFTGDLQPARRHFDGMKRYAAYLGSHLNAEGLVQVPGGGLGDWYDIGPANPGYAQLTPRELTATALYFDDLQILQSLATLLGHARDAHAFAGQAGRVKASYLRAYGRADGFATGSQTANAMSLALGLASADHEAAVLASLVADVQRRGLTAGDVGYRYLLRALADGGRSDVVHAMNNQSDTPGYGYQLQHGATSLTEAWDALRTSSQNHFMLGQINEWFFHDLAGIQPDARAPGFSRVVIRPAVVGDLRSVAATHGGPHGPIRSAWYREGRQLRLELSIPPNSTAEVHLPAAAITSVREGGQRLGGAKGVRLAGYDGGVARLSLMSGNYVFESTLAAAGR
jgi:alpha-L-rhamnosidase